MIIKLTAEDGHVLVNTDHIVAAFPDDESEKTIVSFSTSNAANILVTETIDEILALLTPSP